MTPAQGDIVIVTGLLDPQGRNPKDRACVVLSPTDRIVDGGKIEVAAITTPVPDPLPFDHVMMPWHPRRHPRTGLNKRCAAVYSWISEVESSRVDRIIGHAPGGRLLQIASVLRALHGGDQI